MARFIGMSVVAVGLCVLLALPVLAGKGKKQEKEVTLEQVPAAVKATIIKEAGENTVTEVEEISVDGVVEYYEAEWKADGKEIEIQVAPDGKLLGKEVEDDDGDDDDD